MLCLAFLSFYILGCEDDSTWKVHNHSHGHPDGNEDPDPGPDPVNPDDIPTGAIDKLKRDSISYSGTLDNGDLVQIDQSLDGFPGKVTIVANKGRSAKNTRPIILFTQSIFGDEINDGIKKYADTLKSQNNFIIIVHGLPTPNHDSYGIKKGDTWEKVRISSYKDLHTKATDLLKNGADEDIGGLAYLGNTISTGENIYGKTLDDSKKIVDAFVKNVKNFHANPEDFGIGAWDPFYSAMIIDIV